MTTQDDDDDVDDGDDSMCKTRQLCDKIQFPYHRQEIKFSIFRFRSSSWENGWVQEKRKKVGSDTFLRIPLFFLSFCERKIQFLIRHWLSITPDRTRVRLRKCVCGFALLRPSKSCDCFNVSQPVSVWFVCFFVCLCASLFHTTSPLLCFHNTNSD